ncbi:hypothetical protein MHI22_05870 [Lysinibacillus sp. FSL L8-0312]|uniref:hypothetical protein n=1 Tax=Lysinibacillus sp. FSL L8-0312 TaxID=2921521 RepID=UPI0030F66387
MQDPDYPLYVASVGNEIMLGRQVTETLSNKAIEALENFLLVPLKDRHPHHYQQYSVADAQIVPLDEPTSGLDGAKMGVAHGKSK